MWRGQSLLEEISLKLHLAAKTSGKQWLCPPGWWCHQTDRQTRRSRLKQEVGEFTSGYFEFGTFMSSKVSYFSFEEFKNKTVGFWHWKRHLSKDMGSLGCNEQSCDSAVLHEDGTWDYSMLSLLGEWHPSKAARILWRLMLSQEWPLSVLHWCPRHQLSQTSPPCQYPTLKNNCFLFLLMAVTTHRCFLLWFCFTIEQSSKEYRHWFAGC